MRPKRIPVPGYKKSKPPLQTVRTKSMTLQHELLENRKQILALQRRQKEIRRLLSGQKLLYKTNPDYFHITIKLYALRLEDDCWYVGMTRNPDKRFKKHLSGKGALWTKLHAPIEIVEVRDTKQTDDSAAGLLEDDMTLEYAMKYGSDTVRGGGYCQSKPRWPDVVLQNELVQAA
jgi:predicted GIY-YIG superfamily endonuclease